MRRTAQHCSDLSTEFAIFLLTTSNLQLHCEPMFLWANRQLGTGKQTIARRQSRIVVPNYAKIVVHLQAKKENRNHFPFLNSHAIMRHCNDGRTNQIRAFLIKQGECIVVLIIHVNVCRARKCSSGFFSLQTKMLSGS